jgi:hypothetical protein
MVMCTPKVYGRVLAWKLIVNGTVPMETRPKNNIPVPPAVPVLPSVRIGVVMFPVRFQPPAALRMSWPLSVPPCRLLAV